MGTAGRSAKGSARREEILETASRVIAERGYRGSTLRGIARELGLEPAHVLYYFSSREDLLREVIERWDAGSERLAEDEQSALALFAAAIRHNLRVRGVVHLYLSFAVEAVDAAHPAHEYFRDRFARVTRVLADALAAGIAAGVVRPEVEPERTARLLIAVADGLQLHALMAPEIDAPGELDRVIEDLLVPGRAQIAG